MGLFFKKKENGQKDAPAEEKGAEKEQVVFKTVESQTSFTLRNQDGELSNVRRPNIDSYLKDLFETPEQFVILTSPRTQNGIRYVQACVNEGRPHVELGMEENGGLCLYYKDCSREECIQVFYDFFQNTLVFDKDEYQPLKF